MPPLFNDKYQLDESELRCSLANKAPRRHKSRLISQGFNPETGDIVTFVEHYKWDETSDNIAMAKFSASDKDSDNKKNKNSSKKTKEREGNGKKRRKNYSPRRLRSVRVTVRNVVRTTHFIVDPTEKTIVTPQRIAN